MLIPQNFHLSAVCEDKRNDCQIYANVTGFCQKIRHYMKEYCQKSCGFCTGTCIDITYNQECTIKEINYLDKCEKRRCV